jgi:hypothetical protein
MSGVSAGRDKLSCDARRYFPGLPKDSDSLRAFPNRRSKAILNTVRRHHRPYLSIGTNMWEGRFRSLKVLALREGVEHSEYKG